MQGTDFEAVDESSLMLDPNSAAVKGAAAPAVLTLSRTSLNFGYSGSLVTSPQTVALTFTGASGVSWTASSDQPNITVSPTCGDWRCGVTDNCDRRLERCDNRLGAGA